MKATNQKQLYLTIVDSVIMMCGLWLKTKINKH
jgi:hypothetical protein